MGVISDRLSGMQLYQVSQVNQSDPPITIYIAGKIGGIKFGSLVPNVCFRNISRLLNLDVRYSIVIRTHTQKNFWR